LVAKDREHGEDADRDEPKEILKVPESGSTLTLLGISFVTLAAFGPGFRVKSRGQSGIDFPH
jgi:hypothetical protein